MNGGRTTAPTYALVLVAFLATSISTAAELPTGKNFTNSIGMKFVRIDPGKFVMGSDRQPPASEAEWKEREWDEAPAHKVTITSPFYFGAFEATNSQYEKFDEEHHKLRGQFNVSKTDNEPVTMVSWRDAVDFCKGLSKKEGRTYRLPTEAEWEFACRAGTTTRFQTGDILSVEQANIAGSKRGRTKPVGSYKPNS